MVISFSNPYLYETNARNFSWNLEGLIGGRIYLENDMVKAAEAIEGHIIKKRAALGLG